jgi:hypothetical protein
MKAYARRSGHNLSHVMIYLIWTDEHNASLAANHLSPGDQGRYQRINLETLSMFDLEKAAVKLVS